MSSRHTKHPHIKRMKSKPFWKVSFQLMGVQIRKQGFATYELAEDFYIETRRQIRNGSYFKGSSVFKSSATMKELYEYYCSNQGNKRAVRTQANGLQQWRLHIAPFMGHLRADKVSRRVLAAFVDKLRSKGLVDNSILPAKAEVSNILKLALNYELIDFLPVWPKLSPRPKHKAYFSPEEVLRVVSFLPRAQQKTMALVNYSLMLRINEVMALTPADFNFEDNTVLINKSVVRDLRHLPFSQRIGPTKNRISRVLPITQQLADLVRNHIQTLGPGRDDNGPMWISNRGTCLSEAHYQVALRTAGRSAGFKKKMTSHTLRKSMLTYLLNHSGMSVTNVAYLGRHDVKTLLTAYVEPDTEQVFEFYRSKNALNEVLTCDIAAKSHKQTPQVIDIASESES